MGDVYLDQGEQLRAKVMAIFAEFAGERAERLTPLQSGAAAHYAIFKALSPNLGMQRANEIASHLANWGCDAAFVLALHLFPERFTPREISEGVDLFLAEVPDRVVAAASLFGHSVTDAFGVGAKIEESDPASEDA